MDLMTHSSTFLLPSIPADSGSGSSSSSSLTYALVILNQRIPRFTPLLWKHAHLRICADGGANRVFDELPHLFPHEELLAIRNRYKPDVIKGDMDSVRKEVLSFYANLGTKILDESHDQDTTDLHKCVAYIRDTTPNLEKSNVSCMLLFREALPGVSISVYLIRWSHGYSYEAQILSQAMNPSRYAPICGRYDIQRLCILVAGALGGRFDHEVGNINVLCRFSTTRIILLSEDCYIQLLPSSHHHEIHIQSSVEGPHCGLIPISGPSGSTTTTGLQWDLTDTEMRFGGLISTSNIVKEDKITVKSDSDLLWTISIRKP
ncbi:hypothetical protein LguiB_030486 [Lonicera macranthoides]